MNTSVHTAINAHLNGGYTLDASRAPVKGQAVSYLLGCLRDAGYKVRGSLSDFEYELKRLGYGVEPARGVRNRKAIVCYIKE